LAYFFFTGTMTNAVLGTSLVLIIVGILLMIFGGRAADKIGGK
jgi:hypothetical protein